MNGHGPKVRRFISPRPTYQKVYLSEGLEVRKFICSIAPHEHAISFWYLFEIKSNIFSLALFFWYTLFLYIFPILNICTLVISLFFALFKFYLSIFPTSVHVYSFGFFVKFDPTIVGPPLPLESCFSLRWIYTTCGCVHKSFSFPC